MNEWQPISTAPKDGTTLFLAKINTSAKSRHLWWAISGYWSSEYGFWSDGRDKLNPPTHWTPLPKLSK